jgi:hypothetical protein
MIVKVESQSGWGVFEANHVEYFEDKKINCDYPSTMCPTSYYGKKIPDDYLVKVVLLYKNDQLIQRIIATQTIYLLNDEGKTIERIN